MSKRPPETSIDAYHSLDPSQLAEIYRDILFALSKLGEATTEQLAAFMKVEHSRVWKRMNELMKMDLIYRPGNKRPTKTGRLSYTWMLTDKSLPKTQKSERALEGKAVVDYSREIIAIQSKIF